MHKAVGNGPVPPTTITPVLLRASQILGSTYHRVRTTDGFGKAEEEERRITAESAVQRAGDGKCVAGLPELGDSAVPESEEVCES